MVGKCTFCKDIINNYIGRGANQIFSKAPDRREKLVFTLFYRKLNLFEDLKTIFKT